MIKIIRLLIILLLLIGFAIGFVFVFDKVTNKPAKSKKNTQTTQDNTPKDFSTSKKVSSEEFTFGGWIPNWASQQGYTSLTNNHEKLDSVSPVWYEVSASGSLVSKRPGNAATIDSYAKSQNIKLIPAIAMFDHELFSKVLQNEDNLDRHIRSIIDEIEIYNYDGIDLDYESTKLSDKDQYFVFLKKLKSELQKRDKTLVVTVLAQWDKPTEYSSFKETRQVQDWTEINKYADLIRIMAYDYTYSQSPNPGPIAPESWIKEILDYAVKKVPREKLILGIHLYSYEWFCNEKDFQAETCTLNFVPLSFLNIGQSRTTRSYTYNTVKGVVGQYGNDLTTFENEKIYKYQKFNSETGKQEKRVLVYIDPTGVQSRVNIAKEYGIKGVAFWRLGGEGELLATTK